MELLIGSGNNRKKKLTFEGIPESWTELVTLDMDSDSYPDIVHDLNDLPLPFDDDMFDEIHAYEVLEHVGKQGDWRFFFNQFYEFWRILKPGGHLIGTCPAWDSIWAWSDPGHTRVLTPNSFVFLSQKEYAAQIGQTNMTDYRAYWEGDFDLVAKKEEDDMWGFALQAIKD
jgi:SAM-dependent methyltransferase